MSDSVRPQRRQPTRLPCPWDSPGKNTGVGCHFLPQCMKVKSESEVAQSCPTLSDPTDCSLPGSSVHGIFQTRVLAWGDIALINTPLLIDQIRSVAQSCPTLCNPMNHSTPYWYVKKKKIPGNFLAVQWLDSELSLLWPGFSLWSGN